MNTSLRLASLVVPVLTLALASCGGDDGGTSDGADTGGSDGGSTTGTTATSTTATSGMTASGSSGTTGDTSAGTGGSADGGSETSTSGVTSGVDSGSEGGFCDPLGAPCPDCAVMMCCDEITACFSLPDCGCYADCQMGGGDEPNCLDSCQLDEVPSEFETMNGCVARMCMDACG